MEGVASSTDKGERPRSPRSSPNSGELVYTESVDPIALPTEELTATGPNDGDERRASEAKTTEETPELPRWKQLLAAMDVDAQDRFQVELLRFRFLDYSMQGNSPIFKAFVEDAKWTYSTDGYYHSPKLDAMGKPVLKMQSKELLTLFDSFAMPREVPSTLQPWPYTSNRNLDTTTVDENTIRELREEVIFYSFQRTWVSGASSSDDESTSLEPETSSKPQTTPAATAAGKADHSERRSQRLSSKSVTVTEPGADLLLRQGGSLQSRRKSKTDSKNPDDGDLHKAKLRLSREEYLKEIERLPLDEVVERERAYQKEFANWRFLLATNHSLILYGFGSKKQVLDDFAKSELEKEGDVLTINGFDTTVSMSAILDLVVRLFLDGQEPNLMDEPSPLCNRPRVGVTTGLLGAGAPVVKRAVRISQEIAAKATTTLTPIFFVLHNIDGVAIRSRFDQEALAALVANSTVANGISSIRLVSSVDSVNACGILWDTRTCGNFNWMWKEVHTFRPYTDEITEGFVDNTQQTKRTKAARKLDVSNVVSLLKSLAPRHAKVLQLLAKLQLSSKEKEPKVNFSTFREAGLSQVVIRDGNQLSDIVRELVDHAVVEQGEDRDQGVWFRIPHSNKTLREILAFERG